MPKPKSTRKTAPRVGRPPKDPAERVVRGPLEMQQRFWDLADFKAKKLGVSRNEVIRQALSHFAICERE